MNASLAHLANVPHVVYRCMSVNDETVYIGCTSNLDQRMALHRSDERSRRWLPVVDRIVTETHPDRRTALDAERAAILAERPLFNSNFNNPRTRRVLA